MMRCLLASVGKDAPGVNAALRASTRLALRNGIEVLGARRGFLGILNGEFHKMKESDVGFIIGKGGSVLGSADYRSPKNDEEFEKLATMFKKFDIAVITGGLGSFALLDRLYSNFDLGLTTTLFIPASVENEFLNPKHGEPGATGVHAESIGADTAANTAIEAIDRLREQSYLSRTVFLVECTGLKSNYLPIQIGAACGAHRIYLPRFPRVSPEALSEIRSFFGADFDPNRADVKELVTWVERIFAETKRKYVLVVVPNGTPMISPVARGHDEDYNYENVVTSMAPLELTVLRLFDDMAIHFSGDAGLQLRFVVIDDLQLGGAPSARDRALGSMYGEAAIEEFLSIYNSQDTDKRGNLNLLAVQDTSSIRWKCYPRNAVTSLFKGDDPSPGGLDPLPFFRQMRGTVSGYRPWATV